MAEVISMPKLGFDMAEGVLVRWVLAVGDQVNKGDIIAEIETDKATVEVESNYSGIVKLHLASEGDVLPIGEPIVVIAGHDEDVNIADYLSLKDKEPDIADSGSADQGQLPISKQETINVSSQMDTERYPGGIKASPLARRIALEQEINIEEVKGSGPGGRIVRRDVEEAVKGIELKIENDLKGLTAYSMTGTNDFMNIPADTTVPITKLRSAIGRRMTDSKQSIPHFYVTSEYNMDELIVLRRQVNNSIEEYGEKISLNDFIVKAVSLTLRSFPNLNTSITKDEIIRYGHINVGVAVGLDDGLITIVNKDSDYKSIRQISSETRKMVGRVKEGKVRPDDIEGSTFTVSNLGMFDIEQFVAIINPPEAAILAVGAVREKPIVTNGQILIGKRMKATLSVDHRISDGVEAAKFLKVLGNYLESPIKIIL